MSELDNDVSTPLVMDVSIVACEKRPSDIPLNKSSIPVTWAAPDIKLEADDEMDVRQLSMGPVISDMDKLDTELPKVDVIVEMPLVSNVDKAADGSSAIANRLNDDFDSGAYVN